jgi:signal transduction histidine kinase
MQRAIADLLFSLPDVAVVITDKQRRIASFSPGLVDLVGGAVPERISELFVAIPLFFEDAEGEHRVERACRPTALALRGTLVRDMVLVAYCPDGSRRYLRFNAAPRRSEDRTIVGAVTLVQDVTAEHARVRTEHELRDLLIDTINHGLRTPLTLVLGHAELLEDMEIELPSDVEKSISALVAGATMLSELTRQVSELVDLATAGEADMVTTDLSRQLREEVESLKLLAQRRHVRLRGTFPRHLVASVDPHMLRRALSELVRNALEHAPRGSVVRVTLAMAGEWIETVVDDDGPGIPAEEIARLRRPFESAVERPSKSSGRGLGLAFARVAVTAHGGTLELHPREPTGLRAILRVPRRILPIGEATTTFKS